ncbi:MAG: tetratricopeptide repeat protein [Ignavibacteria bacterium]
MYKFLILYIVFLFIFSSGVFSQEEDSVIYFNKDALSNFIDGTVSELRNENETALYYFNNALKLENSAGIHFVLSKVYYKLLRYQDALLEIHYALKLSPDNIEYLNHLSRVYYALRNYNEVIKTYETIIKIDSFNVTALYSLGRIYEEINQPSKAVAYYEKVIDEYGFDIEVLRRMYTIYLGFKDYQKCIEILKYALLLDPYNQYFKQMLADVYTLVNDNEAAIKIYEDLLRLNPSDKNIKTELIKAYFKLNEIDKGFKNFAKTLGKDSLSYFEKLQVAELYYGLIQQDKSIEPVAHNIFIYLQNQYPYESLPYLYLGILDVSYSLPRAKQYFDKAIQLSDTNKEICLQAINSYFSANYNSEALSLLDKIYYRYSDDFSTNYLYGLVLQRLGEVSESLRYYLKALEKEPDNIPLLSTIAMVYNTLKRYDESDEIHERALEIEPDNALVLNNYAYNLSVRGVNLVKALSMAKRAIEKEPNSASFLDTFGWVLYKMKDFVNARIYIEKSLSINPQNWVVLDHYGDILSALGYQEEAKNAWIRALKINPDSEEIKGKINNLTK